ncbi:MAG: hypothetical protein HY675_12775 [Chloroflexi bacterium]|nr:hypothetical protein [Chloroflexota bacterium]
MNKLLYVPLTRESLEKLAEIAKEERRRPQEQAAYLLEKALSELLHERREVAQCK